MRQRADDELAGGLLRQRRHGGVIEPAIGVAREELVTVDEAGQRAMGLALSAVNDVAVVDDMGAAVVAVAAAARQGHQMRAAEEDLEPVVVEAHPQPVTDEARGHGVEDVPQHEAAGGGHRDHRLLAVLGPPVRQWPQHGALGVDALAVAGVAAADQRVDEAR